MKRLVEEEDPSDPLSDDRLAGLLRNRAGVSLARRTITKYRSVLAIPPSGKRRVWLKTGPPLQGESMKTANHRYEPPSRSR